MPITLNIGGVDYTDYLDYESLQVESSQELKGGTLVATIKIRDGEIPPPVAGQEVILTETYRELQRDLPETPTGFPVITRRTAEFGGTVLRRNWLRTENSVRQIRVECADYLWLFDRRYLNKVYPGGPTPADEAYYAPNIVKEVLTDLRDAARSESGGDEHYEDFAGDLSLITESSWRIRPIRADRQLPSQVIDQITDASGLFWYITPSKQIALRDYLVEQAPLPRSDIIVSLSPFQTIPWATLDVESQEYEATQVYFDHDEEEDISGIGTKCILKNTRIQSTSYHTDEFEWTLESPSTLFQLSRRPFSESTVTNIQIFPHSSSAIEYVKLLEDVQGELGGAEPEVGTVLVYVGSARGSEQSYVRFGVNDLTGKFNANSGGPLRITVRYRYTVVDDREGISVENVAEMARRTGGDGIHEYVF